MNDQLTLTTMHCIRGKNDPATRGYCEILEDAAAADAWMRSGPPDIYTTDTRKCKFDGNAYVIAAVRPKQRVQGGDWLHCDFTLNEIEDWAPVTPLTNWLGGALAFCARLNKDSITDTWHVVWEVGWFEEAIPGADPQADDSLRRGTTSCYFRPFRIYSPTPELRRFALDLAQRGAQ